MQKSLATKEDVLIMALGFLNELGVVRDNFAKEYGLRPNTLSDICNGKILKKERARYRDAAVRKLEALRQNAIMRGKQDVAIRIKDMVYSIAMVELGMASLEELDLREKEEKHKIFMSHFK